MKPGRPVAFVTIAGRRLSALEAALVSLEVTLGRFLHDHVVLLVWPKSKFASASAGAGMKVELGEEDGEEDVWAGTVSRVEHTPAGIRIEGLAPTAALSRERKSQTYQNQGVTDIVRDLASAVTVDQADATLTLDNYTVDTRRTVWGHIVDLAYLANADVSISPSGGLRFVEVKPGPASKTFRFGADLLHWQAAAVAVPGTISYAPHGAASSAGKEKWHWIEQTAADKPSVVIGGFHAKQPADTLTKASEDRAKRAAAAGSATLWGRASLRPGDVVTLDGLPTGDGKNLRVTGVAHTFGAAGFLTRADVEGSGAGGLGGLL